ncbi:hypothetical protein GN956_G8964 [Arapaima gigas]
MIEILSWNLLAVQPVRFTTFVDYASGGPGAKPDAVMGQGLQEAGDRLSASGTAQGLGPDLPCLLCLAKPADSFPPPIPPAVSQQWRSQMCLPRSNTPASHLSRGMTALSEEPPHVSLSIGTAEGKRPRLLAFVSSPP